MQRTFCTDNPVFGIKLAQGGLLAGGFSGKRPEECIVSGFRVRFFPLSIERTILFLAQGWGFRARTRSFTATF